MMTDRLLFPTPVSYVMDWERNRQKEITELTNSGVLPFKHDLKQVRMIVRGTYGFVLVVGA